MQAPLTVRRWRRVDYDRLVALGAFDGESIELIAGELIVAEPQASYHASVITQIDYALRAVLPTGWIVRVQAPVSLDEDSEPEPDLAVVAGTPRDYRHEHPTCPVLVIEVADSSLAFDRDRKGGLYARAGIADYWIVNLVDRAVEVHRDPEPDAGAAFGWRYRSVVRLAPPAAVVPRAFGALRIPAADLLP